MHIRPAEPSQADGRQHESGIGRTVRLGGGASRVPIQPSKKMAETPLRALVSAIGQSLGSRTPVKSSLFSGGGKPSASKPADGTRSKSLFSSEGRANGTSSAAAARSTAFGSSSRIPSTPKTSRTQATARTPSKVPATPISSRVQAFAATPSTRRSSLSSSSSSSYSSSNSASNSMKKQSSSSSTPSSRKVPATPSTPSSRKVPATPSTATRKLDPSSTPVTKKLSMLSRTPKAPKNPITPSSKPLATPRGRAANCTPGSKQVSTPQTRSKSFFPTTPVSKQMAANPPKTPLSRVESGNGFSTPLAQNSSNQAFYTPTSTLALTPLQPRNMNAPESSRKLHFGIDVAAMAEQESMGNVIQRHASAVITEATFSFDKDRLAQIKARQSSSQWLKSPAQRIRTPDFHHPSQTPGRTPGRVLQQVAEDRSARFDEGFLTSLDHSPARRRIANALF